MTEPVSSAEAKAHLRLEDDDPGIDQLSRVITAARMTVEQYLNVTIVNRSRTLVLDAFPTGRIVLPDGPVTEVTEIAYVDPDGLLVFANWRLTNYPLTDVISPLYGEAWPSTRAVDGAVTITYTAGMMTGSPSTLANEDIKSAILLVLGDLWEQREGSLVGVAHTVNPTVERLLHFHRRALGV